MKGEPFVGKSGQFLRNVLAAAGLPAQRVFLGNVCQIRPPDNNIAKFHYNGDEIQSGLRQLNADLKKYQPNCVLLCGGTALRAFGEHRPVHNLRGTIFSGRIDFNEFQPNPGPDFKCVGTYHPAAVLRSYSYITPFRLDINRAKREALTPELDLPQRNLDYDIPFEYVVQRLQDVIDEKPKIAFDLEGYPDERGITCYSIAVSPLDAFIVPFRYANGISVWTVEQEMELWRLTAAILEDPDIPKIAHNAMYELFVFAWRHKIVIRNLVHDTMLSAWELAPELPKELGFQASVYTKEPFYKDERTIPHAETHYLYCCKDSAVTYEIARVHEEQLSSNRPALRHYRFNINLLPPYLYMQLRGCRLDLARLNQHRQRTWKLIKFQQDVVDAMTGTKGFNVRSNKQVPDYLYNTLQLKPFKRMGEEVLKNDFKLLCQLYHREELPVLLEIMKLVKLRTLFSDIHKLTACADGRIRCNYTIPGTETGRLSSRESNIEGLVPKAKLVYSKRKGDTGELSLQYKKEIKSLGTNLQNVTKFLRDCFVPDDPNLYSFYQQDLSGADAWTVAADLAALGNDRMLRHLRVGIKPSMVIVALLDHGHEVYSWSDERLIAYCKAFNKKERRYIVAKQCQHGTNYGMQRDLLAELVFSGSVDGWIRDFIYSGQESQAEFNYIHPYQIERYQKLYAEYYGLALRREYVERQLCDKGYLDCASGCRRRFLSIRNPRKLSGDIVRAALSQEPQNVTTFVTNGALLNMWADPSNRVNGRALKVEPLLMIHDALAGQAWNNYRDYADAKWAEWFNIPLTIHGIDLTIPVDGGWGPNWKDCD